MRIQCSKLEKRDDPVLGAIREVLFEGKVPGYFDRQAPTASILSGITFFSGNDPGMPKDERERVRATLTNLGF